MNTSAINEQEYRLYEIILSQNEPLGTLLNRLERCVETEDSFKTEENYTFLSSALKLPHVDQSDILLTPTLSKINNTRRNHSMRNEGMETKKHEQMHGNKSKANAADLKIESKSVNEDKITTITNNRKRSRIKMESNDYHNEVQDGHPTKKIKQLNKSSEGEARIACSDFLKKAHEEVFDYASDFTQFRLGSAGLHNHLRNTQRNKKTAEEIW